MVLDDEYRQCVMFLGVREDGKFRPRATAFVVSYRQDGYSFNHLVTAQHVIDRLLQGGHEIWVRMNLTDGTAGEFRIDDKAFRYHPDNAFEATDVAVCPLPILQPERSDAVAEMDVRTVALNSDDAMAYTSGAQRGQEIAIVGLFRSHFGNERNYPIIRNGHIAMMRDVFVRTTYCGYIDAYLVEALSIGGLSGSPVFLTIPAGIGVRKVRLLGLMHGHFDVQNMNEDVVADSQNPSTTGIQTGIGVVVPVQKIIETIEHPDLVDLRRRNAERLRGGTS